MTHRSNWSELARPLVVEIAGDSMAPSLERGSRVRIGPLPDASVEPGALLLLSGTSGLYVHRLVAHQPLPSGPGVLHMGDAHGRVGFARAASIIGEVNAVLRPSEAPLPTLAHVDPAVRRRFERARRRCATYGCIRAEAERFSLRRWLPARGRLHDMLAAAVLP